MSSKASGVMVLLSRGGSGNSSCQPRDLPELTILMMVFSLKSLAGAEKVDSGVASVDDVELVVVLVDLLP